MKIRKPNRRSRPARVTQRGTSKSYPRPDYAKLARKSSRWAGVLMAAMAIALTLGAAGPCGGPGPAGIPGGGNGSPEPACTACSPRCTFQCPPPPGHSGPQPGDPCSPLGAKRDGMTCEGTIASSGNSGFWQ